MSKPFVVAHISDTHLSGEKPFFHDNFDVTAKYLGEFQPDLIINTGDVSLNGADSVADLQTAYALHAEIGLRWLALPGNHDIGDNQDIARKQPINDERRQRWLDVFGPDFWIRDVPGWRLLGINSLLLGSDLQAAIEQDEFIKETAASIGNRQLALFLHKPLFINSPEDDEVGGHAVNPVPRAALLACLERVRPRIVASGHLHEHRERQTADMLQIWAPAVSFTLSDWFLPTHGGVHTVGFMSLAFHADGSVETRLVQPSGLAMHDLADFPAAYGDLRQIKADIDAQSQAAA